MRDDRAQSETLRRYRRAKLALPVRLPDLFSVDIKRGQPAAAVAVRVDAHQVAQVEDLAGLLRRVAGNDRFAGNMRAREAVSSDSQRKRSKGCSSIGERRVVIGVNEDVRLAFRDRRGSASRNATCSAGIRARSAVLILLGGSTVRRERRDRPHPQPVREIGRNCPWPCREATVSNISSWLPRIGINCIAFERDQSLEHAAAVRAAVDVIAQGDDHVIGLRLDRFEQRRPERQRAPWTSPMAIVRDRMLSPSVVALLGLMRLQAV